MTVKECIGCGAPQGEPHACWCPVMTGTLRSLPEPPDTLTRENACGRLAMAGYGFEAPGLLDEADKYPGRWAYTTDRHRAVVKHMPAATYEVRDTAESEERIKRAGRR